jgi:hypothetical protein
MRKRTYLLDMTALSTKDFLDLIPIELVSNLEVRLLIVHGLVVAEPTGVEASIADLGIGFKFLASQIVALGVCALNETACFVVGALGQNALMGVHC